MTKFNDIDIILKLIEFQKKYDVNSITVNNICLWPLILSELKFYTNKTDEQKKRIDFFDFLLKEIFGFFKMMRQFYADKKNNQILQKDTEIILLTQSTRREKVKESYFDRISDPFYNALKESGFECSVLEWSFDNEFKVPRHNPSEFIQFMIYKAFLKTIFQKKLRFELDLLNTNEFRDILSGYDVKFDGFLKKIKRNSALIFSVKYMFQKKLKGIKAKTAFFFPHYGIVSFGFNLACKSKNIKTVEIQHAYIGNNKITENAYIENKQFYDLLPDAIWCWEDRDKKRINKWSTDKTKIPVAFTGGNLWINFWKYPKLNKNSFAKSIGSGKNNSRIKILVTLSPYYNIPEWLPKEINKSRKNIDWLIRFHHHTKPEIIKKYKDSFASVTDKNFAIANKNILPFLLMISDMHVTINSSAAYEAKEFGLKTLVLSKEGITILQELIDIGWAYESIEAHEFYSKIALHFDKSENKNKSMKNIKSNKDLISDFLSLIHKPQIDD